MEVSRVFLAIVIQIFCDMVENSDNFKITIVIDAVNKADFNQSVSIVKDASRDLFVEADEEAYQVGEDIEESEMGGLRLTYDIVKALPQQINAQSPFLDRDQNPLRVTSKKVCSEIMNGSIAVVLVHSPNDRSLASAISYALGFYEVPVISVASRDIEFSDKSVHSTFLRTVPPWNQQAEVWVALLEKLGYQKVILLHPDESNAAALVASFRELIDNKEIQIDSSITYRSRYFDGSYFDQMEESDCNIILIYANPDDAYDIFRHYSDRLISGLSRKRVLIANEMTMRANNTPPGLLVVSLKATYELRMKLAPERVVRTSFLREALWTLKQGIAKWHKWMAKQNITLHAPPKCDSFTAMISSKESLWSDVLGPNLYSILLSTRSYRQPDRTLVSFDSGGDRKGAPYVVANVQSQGWIGEPFQQIVGSVVVGEYFYNEDVNAMSLQLDEGAIFWGSNVTEKPKDYTLKTHLVVGTVFDPPFVHVENITDPATCETQRNGPWRICSKVDASSGFLVHYCCRGLCVELLDRLANNNYTKFTYEIRLSTDGQYGAKQPDGKWNGLVGELISKDVDMVVAALSINPERDAKKRSSPMESFMQPFQWQLWLCIFSSVTVIGVIMYGLDKLSPFGRFYGRKTTSNDDDEHPLGLSGAMWFVWGVLLDSGIGERTPRSLSARVLGMVWCGFSMIMVASYTANLAAFLVLDQPTKSLTGITDTRLRNPTPNYTFATVKNSNVHMFFKRHVELSTIYRTMEGRNYETAKAAIDDVKNDKLDAFIWDSTYLEHVAFSDCELQTSGEIFGRAGYGIGLEKGSHWTSIITLAILHAHESGFMQQLDAKYITGVTVLACKQDGTAPVRLGLTNMRDLFILVAGGIVAGFFFIAGEIFYKRHRDSGLRKRQLALHYGRLWHQLSSTRKSRTTHTEMLDYSKSIPLISDLMADQCHGWMPPPLHPDLIKNPPNYYFIEDLSKSNLESFGAMEDPIEMEPFASCEIEKDMKVQGDQMDRVDTHDDGLPPPQRSSSSNTLQDERLAYRPRRAIVV